MAKINGIAGMSPQEISFEINRGGKFVVYRYCFSAVFITVMQGTNVYFVRAGESYLLKSLPWTVLSLLAGWWGIPWGPIRTVQSIWTNCKGGQDVTAAVAQAMKLENVNWATAGAVAK